MERFRQNCQGRFVLILMTLFLVLSLLSAKNGGADDASRFELKIYPANGQYEYQLDEPIELVIVLSNPESSGIYTKGQIVLHQSLIITAPTPPPGNVINFKKEPIIHTMEDGFEWQGEVGWEEAQTLELPLSEIVHDLRDLHPEILRIAGEYIIEARMELILFDRVDWHGPRESWLGLPKDGEPPVVRTDPLNPLKIFISPGFGANLQVRVLNGESQPLSAGIPVKVFKYSDGPAGYDLKVVWQNGPEVLAGITDPLGLVFWESGALCQSKSNYLVLAYYQGQYSSDWISADHDRWNIGCSGSIIQPIIISGEAPQPGDHLEVGNFSLISKKRVSRVAYNYTYKADMTNSGQDVQNAQATLSSNSPHTVVVDGAVDFGDIPAGSTVTSTDTFTIRQDRRYPFSWSDMVWEIQADYP